MIVHVTFKTPDAMNDAITEAVDRERERDLEAGEIYDQDHYDDLAYGLLLTLRAFFPQGEYCRIQVDTVEGTATVLKGR